MIARFSFLLFTLLWANEALAQAPIVLPCYFVSVNQCNRVSLSDPLPVTGSFSISGFTPSTSGARGTPVTVTTSDSSGTLPTGDTVIVTNTGSNPMYCNVNGVAATTSDQLITTSGGWFSFTIPGGGTTLHCIATGGSTTANMVGGAGIASGTGGGSGSSSVTQGTTPWVVGQSTAANLNATVVGTGTFAVQASVPTWAGGTLGAMANYGTSPGAVLVPGVNAFITNANTNGQATMANSAPVTLASDQAGTCTNHAFKHITSATDTLAVQGVTAQTIRLCAWKSRAAGTATWYWENTASTNANCGSTLTQISGVATEAANTGEVVALPLGITLNNTSGNGLCINSTGTGGVDIDFWYAQR